MVLVHLKKIDMEVLNKVLRKSPENPKRSPQRMAFVTKGLLHCVFGSVVYFKVQSWTPWAVISQEICH